MKFPSVEDQAGLHVVPVSQWTMTDEGSKRVKIAESETSAR